MLILLVMATLLLGPLQDQRLVFASPNEANGVSISDPMPANDCFERARNWMAFLYKPDGTPAFKHNVNAVFCISSKRD